ncbi:hypothetical protein Z950_2853 [Sulfitobacter mediterraneus KCTC 32188]|nr:hypothetical protein Z950_2853 [Sulfitobacter mediterraneus KCTC 32188]
MRFARDLHTSIRRGVFARILHRFCTNCRKMPMKLVENQ